LLLIYNFADFKLTITQSNFKLLKMDHNANDKHRLHKKLSQHLQSFFPVLKSRYFYYGLLAILAGIGLNNASQAYLHYYISQGKTLPILSDMILDKIPVVNVSLIYDIFAIIPILLGVVYIIDKSDYNRLPFIFLMIGIFYIVRGIFIVLTPFGNPPMFNGSDPLFHGFANYELGVYPSGHAGNVFLILLLMNSKVYKWLIGICLVVVILALFLAHGHYSIDILSGLFFAYAIRSYGNKHFSMFELGKSITP
jgi:membrane-associated phospholipid phosphatase